MQRKEKRGKQNVRDMKRRLPRLFRKPYKSKEIIIKLVYRPALCILFFFQMSSHVVVDILVTSVIHHSTWLIVAMHSDLVNLSSSGLCISREIGTYRTKFLQPLHVHILK